MRLNNKLYGVLISIMISCLSFISIMNAETHINFDFYQQPIVINSLEGTPELPDLTFSEEGIEHYYRSLKSDDFQGILTQLHKYKKGLNLNDWLFYELIHKTLEECFPSFNMNQNELISWYLLNESGYDTRLSYLNNNIWIYCYTKEEMFEVSMIQDEGRLFVNLSETRRKEEKFEAEVYLLDYNPSIGNKLFSFNLLDLPSFNPKRKTVDLDFTYFEKTVKLSFEIDMALIQLMKDYPFISEEDYLKVPFSSVVSESLIPVLKKEIVGLSEKEVLEFLVSFTRKAFDYKEDHETFGKSKPMIAEEVFFHRFSDCEDRCALFYNLCKEILDIPMLVIALPDHLTIAVASKEKLGNGLNHKGKVYYFCDPTGPFNTSKIGTLPKEYQNCTYQILDTYK